MSSVSSTTASSSPTSASAIQDQYMTLLIAQLQNQDPTAPMDNNQMATQLATFSQLQQMENLNTSFSSVLQSQQVNEGTALIGKTIAYTPANSSTATSGVVTGVQVVNGDVQVTTASDAVDINSILAVWNQ